MEDLKRTWCLPGTAFGVPFKQMKQKHKGTWDLIILLGVSPETSNLKISNLRHPVPRWATEGIPALYADVAPRPPTTAVPPAVPPAPVKGVPEAPHDDPPLDYTRHQLRSFAGEYRLPD